MHLLEWLCRSVVTRYLTTSRAVGHRWPRVPRSAVAVSQSGGFVTSWRGVHAQSWAVKPQSLVRAPVGVVLLFLLSTGGHECGRDQRMNGDEKGKLRMIDSPGGGIDNPLAGEKVSDRKKAKQQNSPAPPPHPSPPSSSPCLLTC